MNLLQPPRAVIFNARGSQYQYSLSAHSNPRNVNECQFQTAKTYRLWQLPEP